VPLFALALTLWGDCPIHHPEKRLYGTMNALGPWSAEKFEKDGMDSVQDVVK
jgi:hypothetical protein